MLPLKGEYFSLLGMWHIIESYDDDDLTFI